MESVPIRKDADVYETSNGKLWDWLFHEENLFTSRLAVFLTAHSLLLTAMAFTMRQGSAQKNTILFPALGVILGVIWLLESVRGARNIHVLCEALKRKATFSRFSAKMWSGRIGKVRRSWMAVSLAGMAIYGWGVLLLYLYAKFCMEYMWKLYILGFVYDQ